METTLQTCFRRLTTGQHDRWLTCCTTTQRMESHHRNQVRLPEDSLHRIQVCHPVRRNGSFHQIHPTHPRYLWQWKDCSKALTQQGMKWSHKRPIKSPLVCDNLITTIRRCWLPDRKLIRCCRRSTSLFRFSSMTQRIQLPSLMQKTDPVVGLHRHWRLCMPNLVRRLAQARDGKPVNRYRKLTLGKIVSCDIDYILSPSPIH